MMMMVPNDRESAVPSLFTVEMRACPENDHLVRSLVDRAADSWGMPDDLRHTGTDGRLGRHARQGAGKVVWARFGPHR